MIKEVSLRFRVVAVATLAVVGLSACTGSGGGADNSTGNSASALGGTAVAHGSGSAAATDSSAGGTGSAAAFCTKLEQASTKLGDVGASGSDLSKLKLELEKAVSYFEDLDSAAPTELKPSIEDLISAMKAAAKAIADPTSADPAALQDLAAKVTTDSQKLSGYVVEHCTGG